MHRISLCRQMGFLSRHLALNLPGRTGRDDKLSADAITRSARRVGLRFFEVASVEALGELAAASCLAL
jgi:hypothetical protein